MVIAAFSLLAISFSDPLQELEASLQALKPETSWEQRAEVSDKVLASLQSLVENDTIRLHADLFRASKILALVGDREFIHKQARYEMILAAVAGGDVDARKDLGAAWDELLMGMSRGRRIGAVPSHPGPGMERFRLQASPKGILEIWLHPERAQKKDHVQNHAELQAIVDADQKARQGDWSKFTQADFLRLAKEDDARLKRVKALIAKSAAKTGQDFFNAALVCQHGQTFEDYALAHELSVCGMLFGHQSSAWLAGASYDRMFSNSGYAQRFATQYSIRGGKTTLSRFEPAWINDSIRKLVVRVTLQEAQNRKF